MEDLYVKNLTEEYEKKRPLYEEFCLAANKLLINILEQKKYKYQIYYRVKNSDRFKEKIIKKRKRRKIYENLPDVEDLAGVRIIFYLESEKEKFIKDLKNEIPNIVRIKEVEKKSGYKAKHIIMTLDKKRLELSEYKKFENLKCEVQLVSIFNHAWAELEHDWLYKNAHKFKNENRAKYKNAKKQMENIFKNYVRKLNSRFEKVAKILNGKDPKKN